MAVAEPRDLRVGQREGTVAVVQHNEVIAGTVHFGEMQTWHRGSFFEECEGCQ
jgi:hypothetical protein